MSYPYEVSVVIPTHGRPNLLVRAILSALAQTCRSLEVVVVLDGADEVTRHAVAGINDRRLRLITVAKAAGGGSARNTGARAARGRYIALLDDDDEWLPDKIEKQLKLAESCTAEFFAVVSQYRYRVPGRADEVWPGHLPAEGEPLSEFLFSSRGGFQTSTYLCRRDLFLALPFTEGLKKHQDWDWFLQLSSLPGFRLLVVEEPLSIYWVPLRSRESVSGRLDWRFSFNWARGHRGIMTGKAYALFLTKICARSAAIQKESVRGLAELMREFLFAASPTPLLVMEFLATVVVHEELRMRLRYALMRMRLLGSGPATMPNVARGVTQ